ncbi:MAG: 3-dehydroquinate synthase, partial [Planctomycetota bacterium]
SAEALAARDTSATSDAIAAAIALKAQVVAADPFERDGRRALNLGHTFGHALEHAAGYGVIPHGEAVAVGMTLALRTSAKLGLLEDLELGARYDALAERLGLARDVSALAGRYGVSLSRSALSAGLAHDKKGRVGAPEFVLPRRAGALALGVTVPAALLDEVWGAA